MRIFYLLLTWSACEGDLNCDGVVDGADMAIFANDFDKQLLEHLITSE
jgi:hypothetical protein